MFQERKSNVSHRVVSVCVPVLAGMGGTLRACSEVHGGRATLLAVLQGIHLHRVFSGRDQRAHLKLNCVPRNVLHHWSHCRTGRGEEGMKRSTGQRVTC